MEYKKVCLRESEANDLDAIVSLYKELAPDDYPYHVIKPEAFMLKSLITKHLKSWSVNLTISLLLPVCCL